MNIRTENVEVEAYPRSEDEPRFRQAWELPLAIRDVVPYAMRDLVCTCVEDHKQVPGRVVHSKSLFICNNCKKYVRWIQRVCMRCDERFVLTFSHPRYVTMWPTCWDCTQDTTYDPWYEMAQRFPKSYIAECYYRGIYDSWPGKAIPVVEPLPSDLKKKEPITTIEFDDTETLFDF